MFFKNFKQFPGFLASRCFEDASGTENYFRKNQKNIIKDKDDAIKEKENEVKEKQKLIDALRLQLEPQQNA